MGWLLIKSLHYRKMEKQLFFPADVSCGTKRPRNKATDLLKAIYPMPFSSQHPRAPVVPPHVRYDWSLLAPTPSPTFSEGTTGALGILGVSSGWRCPSHRPCRDIKSTTRWRRSWTTGRAVVPGPDLHGRSSSLVCGWGLRGVKALEFVVTQV